MSRDAASVTWVVLELLLVVLRRLSLVKRRNRAPGVASLVLRVSFAALRARLRLAPSAPSFSPDSIALELELLRADSIDSDVVREAVART